MIAEVYVRQSGVLFIKHVRDDGLGEIEYSSFPHLIIRKAWECGITFEDLIDSGEDAKCWESIARSSPRAIDSMLTRALKEMTFGGSVLEHSINNGDTQISNHLHDVVKGNGFGPKDQIASAPIEHSFDDRSE